MSVQHAQVEPEQLAFDAGTKIVRLILDLRIDLKFITAESKRIRSRPLSPVKTVTQPEPKVPLRKDRQIKVAEMMQCIRPVLRASRDGLREYGHMVLKVIEITYPADVRIEFIESGLVHVQPERSRRVGAPPARLKQCTVKRPVLRTIVLDVQARIEDPEAGPIVLVASVFFVVAVHIQAAYTKLDA